MILFILLSVCMCAGLCDGDGVRYLNYGNSHTLQIPENGERLVFKPVDGDAVSLWRRKDAQSRSSNGHFTGTAWEFYKLTQDQSGTYTVSQRGGRALVAQTIVVSEYKESFNKSVTENMVINFPMDSALCLLVFSNDDGLDLEVFRGGELLDDYFGQRLVLNSDYHAPSFNLNLYDLKTSDTGHFKLYDLDYNLALDINLVVTAPVPVLSYLGTAVSVILSGLCCCCVKRCCCRKSVSKKDEPRHTNTEAPALRECVSEPPGPRYSEPTQPLFLTTSYQAPRPTHSSLVYNPASINVPASSAQAPQGPSLDSDTRAPNLDAEPRFELKGFHFDNTFPLSPGSTCGSVYTSDKLNFL